MIISQTCDLVQPGRPNAQLAPVVRRDPIPARESRLGRWPQYVHVPDLGDDAFADLSLIASIDKDFLISLERRPGVDPQNDRDVRDFGRAIGRRFARFPFPDEVTPWLRPLQAIVQSKANRPNSPLGQVLSQIIELRLEAINGWTTPAPYDLTLIVIVESGTLPVFADDAAPATDSGLHDLLYDHSGKIQRTPQQVAELLIEATEPARRTQLWVAVGDALAAACRPEAGQEDAIMNAISSISGEVVSEDELSYARAVRSEEIDLDHLSPPRPR